MARILLGVTGGIAAYKALEFARLAVKAGHAVRVLETEAAAKFVGPVSFATITGAPVLIHDDDPDELRGTFPGDPPLEHLPLAHLELVERADIYVVAPASANTIAKLATGAGDNLLTTAALASRGPLLIAPAMNAAMYENPATQANLDVLRSRGVMVLEPGEGSLGSLGEWGVGRLVEPPELLAACEAVLQGASDSQAVDSPWRGRSVLVTAGGTREPIDAVRFLGNRSSGRMGFAIASAAARLGANVTVIAANVSLPREAAVRYIDVSTAAELADACYAQAPDADVIIMAAAVADFRPRAEVSGKLKKERLGESFELELERTEDVLSRLASQRARPGQIIVGFAAEHGSAALKNARSKLVTKNVDAIVVNDVSVGGIGFDSDHNAVTIITREREIELERASKDEIARGILATLENKVKSVEIR